MNIKQFRYNMEEILQIIIIYIQSCEKEISRAHAVIRSLSRYSTGQKVAILKVNDKVSDPSFILMFLFYYLLMFFN